MLRRAVRRVFGDNEGEIAPKQQDIAEERTATDAEQLIKGVRRGSTSRIHVRELDMDTIYKIIQSNHRCHPGHFFLADHKKPWMEGKVEVDLPLTFERRLQCVELDSAFSSTFHRRTRLDFLIHHVFEQLSGPKFSEVLSLKNGLEFTYRDIFYSVPYYSLWYGPVDELATNFVIVHTETPGYFDEAEVLAIMSWVYLARVHFGKRNCTVYGLATNSHEYWFYQINDRGKWSHTVLKPSDDYYHENIAALLGFIFNEAYLAAQETPNPRRNTVAKLQVKPLSCPDTWPFTFERLPPLPDPGSGWTH